MIAMKKMVWATVCLDTLSNSKADYGDSRSCRALMAAIFFIPFTVAVDQPYRLLEVIVMPRA